MQLQNMTKLAIVFCITLLLSTTLLITHTNPVSAATKNDLAGTSVIARIVEKSSPSVVWVSTTYETPKNPLASLFGNDDEEGMRTTQGLGSGFFFDEDGYILTNAHVVDGAKSIEIILKDQKEPLKATLVGKDRELDVAILKIETKTKVPALKFGNSDKMRVGEWVVAIGNPHGLDHTVTLGIISAKGRPIVIGGRGTAQFFDNMIQTDAAINPGNSGGPLLNLDGEVIGINSAVSSTGQGLGFAIPINKVKDILDELKTKGKISRPWLGVSMVDLKGVRADVRTYLGADDTDGVLLQSVVKGSPAEKANLQRYDVILEINHKAFDSAQEVVNFIHRQKVGDKLSLLILRKGELMKVEVTLAEKPE